MSRTPSLRRALVAAAAALAVPLTAAPLAGAASAAQLTVTDARGDVWKMNDADMEDPDAPMWVKAPEAPTGDLTKVTFAHSAKRVVVKARYVALEKPRGEAVFALRARDNAKGKWSMGVVASKRQPAGQAMLMDHRGNEIPCDGVRHKVDYRKAQIALSVPRSCLEDPRWLQFTAVHYDSQASRRSFSFYVDNPHSEKAEPKGWTEKVKVG